MLYWNLSAPELRAEIWIEPRVLDVMQAGGGELQVGSRVWNVEAGAWSSCFGESGAPKSRFSRSARGASEPSFCFEETRQKGFALSCRREGAKGSLQSANSLPATREV